MKVLSYDSYLNEDKLYEILLTVFSTVERQKVVTCGNKKFKVDFFIPEINTFVEFDGWRHYNSSANQARDDKVSTSISGLGCTLVRMPYWLQLDNDVFCWLFGVEVFNKFVSEFFALRPTYKHGFIDSKALLPADFNSGGWNRFIEEYSSLTSLDNWSVMRDVYESLDRAGISTVGVDHVEFSPAKFFERYPT